MIRSATLAVGLILRTTDSMAQTDHTVQSWPRDIGKVTCDAFKRSPDGSWTTVKTIIVQTGNDRLFSGTTFRNSEESRHLDQRCRGG